MNRSPIPLLTVALVAGLLVACDATEGRPACAAALRGPGPGAGSSKTTTGTGTGSSRTTTTTTTTTGSLSRTTTGRPPARSTTQNPPPPRRPDVGKPPTLQRGTTRYPAQKPPTYRGSYRHYDGYPGWYPAGVWPDGYAETYGCDLPAGRTAQ
ncbi:hypothetical protein GCM10027187_40040 [Streptosporangium sandarakinum]|uniref:Lipoprotein n=1 Tax=Streptosporangium sandarakinum TaxID=1260955 RepID=A0A852VC85_9ACTN|nr:hypothetical protein [Streptosporangium sandarakinum]NYF44664.1 hypothetical protein [Streptosporangium sandarakinum]